MTHLSTRTACLALSTLVFASVAQAETVTFDNPKVGSQPLDLCLDWGEGCGKPAADAWCVSSGFDESVAHVVAENIGLSTPTRLISTGAVCDQEFCDGIAQVTCARPDPQEQVYNKPKFMGKRLDYCAEWGAGCGEQAATLFCQAEGWAMAKAFEPAEDIGASSPTRVITTMAICDQAFCDGFASITCGN